ncbi:acyl carrier protein [Hydrogeniiclostridium mannosilyticum]|uniref:acyl carrier protein n=1 Tax=Hydrogeniiclostridium mannosilyticum TaxID=2764322 RepID=UPI00399AB3BF
MNQNKMELRMENGENTGTDPLENGPNIQQQVLAVASKNLNIESLSVETNLLDLKIDSISFIKTVVALEEEFDIAFEDDYLYIEALPTIDAMIRYISSNL